MAVAKKVYKEVFSFWFLLMFIAFSAGLIAFYVYRGKFGGDFSNQSADWSAFGSYIGGLLGPLVSLLTLAAVLKTVYLQRELLDTQKKEFISLSEQQSLSLQRQDEQLRLSREESERVSVQDYLANQFKLIDVLISQQQRQAEAMSQAAQTIVELHQGSLSERMKSAEPALAKKDKAVANVNTMISLSIELSVTEFKSTTEILRVVGPRLLEVIDQKPEPEKDQQSSV